MSTLLVPPYSTKSLLEKATALYETQLPGSPGESHLLGRGITNETTERFRLGYVADPLSGDERYTGRISIPYHTISGIVSVRYRATTDAKPKYLSSAGDVTRPFNVLSLNREGTVYITEGEMDAIVLDQLGFAAVGIPGATQWQRVYGRILRFRPIVVLADGDEAGRSFADDVLRDLPSAKFMGMPESEDVNSMFLSLGTDKFIDWITK